MSSALRRKLAPSRAAAMPGGSSVDALLHKILPRVADGELSLDLAVGPVVLGVMDKAEVMQRLQPADLIYPLAGKATARGICTLTAGLLAGLIEVQMSGRVTRATPAERQPTRTDGIVAGDIVDAWMAASCAAAEDEGIAESLPIIGYSRASGILDRRNCDLSLDPQTYRTLLIDLTLGDQAKTGTLFFATPQHIGAPARTGETAAARMHRHLGGMAAPMTAILTRLSQPIERARNLAVGHVLKVPVSALVNVRLEAGGGKLIARARLGQLNGQKAVRLNLKTGGPPVSGAPPVFMFDAGKAAALPDLPDLPAPQSAESMPPLADLPDLPELPDLPALPDLPDLD